MRQRPRMKGTIKRIGVKNLLLLVLGLHVLFIYIFRVTWWSKWNTEQQVDPEADRDFDFNVYGESPPVIKARVDSSVQEINWDSDHPTSTCMIIKPIVKQLSNAEPVIVRGAVNWKAMDVWNLTWLAKQDFDVDVWIAPSMHFYYIKEEILHKKMEEREPNLPVAHKMMSAREAVDRMQTNSSYPPAYFSTKESYYIRSDLTPFTYKYIDLHSGALSCALQHVPLHKIKQKLRMWVSPKGAISPLHFDGGTSCLVQLRGQKRMVLYQRKDMENIYPYPDDHFLRRRGQVDPTNPDYDRFPKYKSISGKLAILNPGDAIFFPSNSPHYTDTLETSVSLTMRW